MTLLKTNQKKKKKTDQATSFLCSKPCRGSPFRVKPKSLQPFKVQPDRYPLLQRFDLVSYHSFSPAQFLPPRRPPQLQLFPSGLWTSLLAFPHARNNLPPDSHVAHSLASFMTLFNFSARSVPVAFLSNVTAPCPCSTFSSRHSPPSNINC